MWHSAFGAALRVLHIVGVRLLKPRGTHIGFRSHTKTNGQRATVEIEDHSLALSKGTEDRTHEGAAGELIVIEIRVADDGAHARNRVIGLDDSLQRTSRHGQRTALTTLPALRHDVHTLTRLVEPLTTARTRWMFGFQRRFVRRWEWLTAIPNDGCFPHTSHTAAMTTHSGTSEESNAEW